MVAGVAGHGSSLILIGAQEDLQCFVDQWIAVAHGVQHGQGHEGAWVVDGNRDAIIRYEGAVLLDVVSGEHEDVISQIECDAKEVGDTGEVHVAANGSESSLKA